MSPRPPATHARSLRRVGWGICLLLAVPAVGRAQDPPHVERSIGGTLINQNYFTAAEYPEVKATLVIVEYAHLNEEVVRHFNEGRYGLALGDIKYTLDKFPNHPLAIHMFCAISKSNQQISLPIPIFEKALRYYPREAYTHAQYGKYLTEIGAVNAGIQELEEALRLDPNLPLARAWLLQVRPERGAGGGAPTPSGPPLHPAPSRETRSGSTVPGR